MLARIVSFRRGRRTVRHNQMIVDFGLDTKEQANKKMGTKIVYKTKTSEIHGVVSRVHGNSGKVVARFNKGMPGQSLGKNVEIKNKETKETKKAPVKKTVTKK